MKTFIRTAAVILSAIIASASLTACGEDKKSTDTSSITESSSAPAEKPSREKLKQLIAGDWGRLGEVMHTFYNDNACIIGGMFGTYQISSDCSLIMITEGGTRTEESDDPHPDDGTRATIANGGGHTHDVTSPHTA